MIFYVFLYLQSKLILNMYGHVMFDGQITYVEIVLARKIYLFGFYVMQLCMAAAGKVI